MHHEKLGYILHYYIHFHTNNPFQEFVGPDSSVHIPAISAKPQISTKKKKQPIALPPLS